MVPLPSRRVKECLLSKFSTVPFKDTLLPWERPFVDSTFAPKAVDESKATAPAIIKNFVYFI
jgi:hypothetical protein